MNRKITQPVFAEALERKLQKLGRGSTEFYEHYRKSGLNASSKELGELITQLTRTMNDLLANKDWPLTFAAEDKFKKLTGKTPCNEQEQLDFIMEYVGDDLTCAFAIRGIVTRRLVKMGKLKEAWEFMQLTPKCESSGWRQDRCQYGPDDRCIHCGKEVPF